jgi:transposase
MRKEDMGYDIYCGIDIGKSKHYVTALDSSSERRILSSPLRQDEREIEELLNRLCTLGKILVTVDQYGDIGRLVVAVAQRKGIDVAHLSPRTFRKAADTYSELKTDAFDSYVIADVSRSTPRMIELLVPGTEAHDELKALCTLRCEIVKERTSYYNRLHENLQKISPPLEGLFAKEALHADIALRLLEHYGGPTGFKKAGKSRVIAWAGKLKNHRARGVKATGAVFEALQEMTVELPAAAIIEDEIKRLARRLIELEALEKKYNVAIKTRTDTMPEVALLKSMPGMGDILAASAVAEIGDITRFRNADHLASYAGVAPVKRESGKSVKGSRKPRGGNRNLKGTLTKYAQIACIHDPAAKAYYDKKRSQGKTHSQALLCLARRRLEVIYAMLSNGTYYKSLNKAA